MSSIHIVGPSSYVCDVEVAGVSQLAPLGVSEAKRFHDAVVGQRLLLRRRDAPAGEVIPCTHTGDGPVDTWGFFLFDNSLKAFQLTARTLNRVEPQESEENKGRAASEHILKHHSLVTLKIAVH